MQINQQTQDVFAWLSKPRNSGCLAASTGAGSLTGAGLGLAGGPGGIVTIPVGFGGGGLIGWGGGMISCMSATPGGGGGSQPASSDSGSKPRLISNLKHHPNSASPEPSNVQELFEKSIEDGSGVRWAKDPNGAIHRFSRPSNGETHWNGSTVGSDPIRMDDIPIAIRRLLR